MLVDVLDSYCFTCSQAVIKRMDGLFNRKPREAFDRWHKHVSAINKNEILDNIRSQKLLVCLKRIPIRKMRDSTQRIAGEGDKVREALKKIFSAMQRLHLRSGGNTCKDLRTSHSLIT